MVDLATLLRSAGGASRAAPGRPPQDRARPAHTHGLASIATLCGGIGTVGALWILLALLGFLPTVGGTNPVRFESNSILGMRIQSHWLPTTGQYLAYQRDTYTRVTGRDLQLEGGRTTSLFKTMQETLDLARTNIASGVTADTLKPIKDLHGWNNLNEVYRAAKYESIYGTALEDDVGRAYNAGLERAIQTGSEIVTRSDHRKQHLEKMRKKIKRAKTADRNKKQAEAKQQEEQQRARPGRRAQEVMNGTLPVEPSDVGRNARAHTNTLAPFLGDFTILRF